MNTKRLFLYLPLLLALMIGSVGCSKDDCSENEGESSDVLTNEESNITFSLCDEAMTLKTSFREGENIVFVLSINNTSDSNLTIKRDFEGGDLILDSHFFCVYNAKGEIVGVPWTGVFCEESGQDTWYYPAHSTHNITCDWNQEWIGLSHPFCDGYDMDMRRPSLSKGDYSVRFTIKYNSNVGKEPKKMKSQEYIVHFKIV